MKDIRCHGFSPVSLSGCFTHLLACLLIPWPTVLFARDRKLAGRVLYRLAIAALSEPPLPRRWPTELLALPPGPDAPFASAAAASLDSPPRSPIALW